VGPSPWCDGHRARRGAAAPKASGLCAGWKPTPPFLSMVQWASCPLWGHRCAGWNPTPPRALVFGYAIRACGADTSEHETSRTGHVRRSEHEEREPGIRRSLSGPRWAVVLFQRCPAPARAKRKTSWGLPAGVQYTVLCRQRSSFVRPNTVSGSPGNGVPPPSENDPWINICRGEVYPLPSNGQHHRNTGGSESRPYDQAFAPQGGEPKRRRDRRRTRRQAGVSENRAYGDTAERGSPRRAWRSQAPLKMSRDASSRKATGGRLAPRPGPRTQRVTGEWRPCPDSAAATGPGTDAAAPDLGATDSPPVVGQLSRRHMGFARAGSPRHHFFPRCSGHPAHCGAIAAHAGSPRHHGWWCVGTRCSRVSLPLSRHCPCIPNRVSGY
jgi:hypothetical protein